MLGHWPLQIVAGPPSLAVLDTLSSVASQVKKISKFVVTGCQILKLKRTKFDFCWDSTADPAEELSALPQTPLLDLKGPLLR